MASVKRSTKQTKGKKPTKPAGAKLDSGSGAVKMGRLDAFAEFPKVPDGAMVTAKGSNRPKD